MSVRPAAVAGTWYPGTRGALARDVDAHLESAGEPPAGSVNAVIVPHAGLMFSGPVGAWAWKAAAREEYDVAILVGPSHFVGFEGAATYPGDAFDSPFGPARIDRDMVEALQAFPVVRPLAAAHAREHSLEMQLPFLRRLLPDLPIVPVLMGYQSRATIHELAKALSAALEGRRPLLVASTDLSHYFDADTAVQLDGRVRELIGAFDADGLLRRFEEYPETERGRYVACGGGAAISVMMAARALGAREARVLKYAHSGEVSGDYGGVVGYLAAALGSFDRP